MPKNTKSAEIATENLLETIKKTTIISIFSDDDLLDIFVLKGGNAMDIVHKISSRASVDIDFSVDKDFDIDMVWPKIENAIKQGFADKNYFSFDIKVAIKPKEMPSDLASFWGGYMVEFKIISMSRAQEVNFDIQTMRREAVMLGQGSKFTIDISNHEYTAEKQAHELDGYTVYVYTPEMIVCEKLRAICQQMPEYAAVIKRKGLGNQRARDFIDIEILIRVFNINLNEERIKFLATQMFNIKHVDIKLLGKIQDTMEFHAQGYDEVRATMNPGIEIHPFEYYFNFVLEHIKKLESIWNV